MLLKITVHIIECRNILNQYTLSITAVLMLYIYESLVELCTLRPTNLNTDFVILHPTILTRNTYNSMTMEINDYS